MSKTRNYNWIKFGAGFYGVDFSGFYSHKTVVFGYLRGVSTLKCVFVCVNLHVSAVCSEDRESSV